MKNRLIQLKNDVKSIVKEDRMFIKADKSNNYYKMKSQDYKNLVEKEVTKEYKKVRGEM